jgi:hypothetical protein
MTEEFQPIRVLGKRMGVKIEAIIQRTIFPHRCDKNKKVDIGCLELFSMLMLRTK